MWKKLKNNLIIVLWEFRKQYGFHQLLQVYYLFFSIFVEAELDYLHIFSIVISVRYLSNNEVLSEDLNTGGRAGFCPQNI